MNFAYFGAISVNRASRWGCAAAAAAAAAVVAGDSS